MNDTISSLEDVSSILDEGRAKKMKLRDIPAMEKSAWRQRLERAIENSGKSKRSISLEAGLGPGYVHSILKEGKDPTIDNIIAVCGAAGVSLSFILYGLELSRDTEEILRLLENRTPNVRDGILKILREESVS